jgi:hypothetical protein
MDFLNFIEAPIAWSCRRLHSKDVSLLSSSYVSGRNFRLQEMPPKRILLGTMPADFPYEIEYIQQFRELFGKCALGNFEAQPDARLTASLSTHSSCAAIQVDPQSWSTMHCH